MLALSWSVAKTEYKNYENMFWNKFMNISKYRLCLKGQSSNKMEHYIPVTLTAVTLHVTETPLQKKKKKPYTIPWTWGWTDCPKILVTNCKHTLHDILAERRPLGNFQISPSALKLHIYSLARHLCKM